MAKQDMIFHLVEEEAWVRAVARGEYAPPSLAQEGFVHLSTAAQVRGTFDRFFKGRTDLLVLHVDEAKLTAPLKYEAPRAPAGAQRTAEGRATEVGQQFPHHYGPLPLSAVTKVEPFKDWKG